MIQNQLRSVAHSLTSSRLMPEGASDTLILSEVWINAHVTALARAEMSFDKLIKESYSFLLDLQEFSVCVYSLPSGSERYRHPFALGIKGELQKLIESRDVDALEHYMSQLRKERARWSDLVALLTKRADLKAMLHGSFKHVYNNETRALDVFLAINSNVAKQWEVKQIVDGLQQLENFKSQFLSSQFSEISDFLWKMIEKLDLVVQAAKQVTPDELMSLEATIEAEYIRHHFASPGDDIWLPNDLRQKLELQRMEQTIACKNSLYDHLTKSHGPKALKDIDLEVILQGEPAFQGEIDTFFRRLVIIKSSHDHLSQSLVHVESMLNCFKQLLEIQLVFYRLPRAVSAPSVVLESTITGLINKATETASAIQRVVGVFVQTRVLETWQPYLRPDAVALIMSKVLEQAHGRGDIAYYRAKLAELEHAHESIFGGTHEKIARNRLKLGEIQREYQGEVDDLRADFNQLQVVCKDCYREFEYEFFKSLLSILKPLGISLKNMRLPFLAIAVNRRAHSAAEHDPAPHTVTRQVSASGDETNKRLSRRSTSVRNVGAKDVRIQSADNASNHYAHGKAHRIEAQIKVQATSEQLNLTEVFCELLAEVSASELECIHISKVIEGSNFTGRFVEWACVRKVSHSDPKLTSLQGGIIIAINGESMVGLPVYAVEAMLRDTTSSAETAILSIRKRKDIATQEPTSPLWSSSRDFRFEYRIKCMHERTAPPKPVPWQLTLAKKKLEALLAESKDNQTAKAKTYKPQRSSNGNTPGMKTTKSQHPPGSPTRPAKAPAKTPTKSAKPGIKSPDSSRPSAAAAAKTTASPRPTGATKSTAAKNTANTAKAVVAKPNPSRANTKSRPPPSPKPTPKQRQSTSNVPARSSPPAKAQRSSAPNAVPVIPFGAPRSPQSTNSSNPPSPSGRTPSRPQMPKSFSESLRKPSKPTITKNKSEGSFSTPSKTKKKFNEAEETKTDRSTSRPAASDVRKVADENRPAVTSAPVAKQRPSLAPIAPPPLPEEFLSALTRPVPPPPSGKRPPSSERRPASTRVTSLRLSQRLRATSTDSQEAGSRGSSKLDSIFGTQKPGSPDRKSQRPGSKRVSKRMSKRLSEANPNAVVLPPPPTPRSTVLSDADTIRGIDLDDVRLALENGNQHRRTSSLHQQKVESRNTSPTRARPDSAARDISTFVFGAEGVSNLHSADSILRARATRRRTPSIVARPDAEQNSVMLAANTGTTPIWERRRRSSRAEVAIRAALSKANFDDIDDGDA